MRPLGHARTRAHECRCQLGLRPGLSAVEILKRLQVHLSEKFEVEIVRVNRRFLRGGRGEIAPDERLLYVDEALDATERLEVVAHELGHYVLHHHHFGPSSIGLLRGSAFLEQAAPSLSRYSPRSQEEAEASAFAAELICPAKEIFSSWKQNTEATVAALAAQFAARPSLVGVQLAEGLHRTLAGQKVAVKPSSESPTPQQEIAATTIGVPILVDAGPGTGKTKTLVRRVEYLITVKKAEPEQCLVLTFSNEAATELQERLESSLGVEVAGRILTSTFHGFGVRLLHAFGDEIGIDINFSIMEEAAHEEMITDLLGKVDCDALLNLKDLVESAREISGIITYLKDRLVGPEELRRELEDWSVTESDRRRVERTRALLRLFEVYEETKKVHGNVDFADLILLPGKILMEREELRNAIRSEFPWILVDEYQDVSRGTAQFLQQIAGPCNPPWVVGDARQSIYRFRGAEPENVQRFADDFPGARYFELQSNFRSAPEIIHAANELAALLENHEGEGSIPERWKPGRRISTHGEKPIRLVRANSDKAERRGIARVVKDWLSDGVEEEDIAVLARRNVDVRNIAVELKRLGVRAVTTGILTSEGAAGDLAAVITAVDHPAAMSRVIYAINRGMSSNLLNPAVRQVLESEPGAGEPVWTGLPETKDVASDAWRLREHLTKCRGRDGWSVLTHFLFFETDYLRELLSKQEGSAEADVQIEEILSTLALAATYRFSHAAQNPFRARLGFVQRLRHLLTHPAPGLVPPREKEKAIQVMTCHAAKGLEFPCVVVAGQSLPDLISPEPPLPPRLRPDDAADLAQADSLLFVGVTRGQRAVVVSHATTASGTPRSRHRKLPRLLESWISVRKLEEWNEVPTMSEEITVGRIWGGSPPEKVSMYGLGSETCRVKIYLEEQIGRKFRGREYPLYPEFIKRVRSMLARLAQRALEAGTPISEQAASVIADEEWPPEVFADHPHYRIYRPRAKQWALRFARVFHPEKAAVEFLPSSLEWEGPLKTAVHLRLQLIARFRDARDQNVAIALQVKAPDTCEYTKWGQLSGYKRLPFVLLKDLGHDVVPLVFYGESGELRVFRWSTRKPREAIEHDAGAARTAFSNLTMGRFDGTVSDWVCDRCSSRIVCPWWIGATNSGPE